MYNDHGIDPYHYDFDASKRPQCQDAKMLWLDCRKIACMVTTIVMLNYYILAECK